VHFDSACEYIYPSEALESDGTPNTTKPLDHNDCSRIPKSILRSELTILQPPPPLPIARIVMGIILGFPIAIGSPPTNPEQLGTPLALWLAHVVIPITTGALLGFPIAIQTCYASQINPELPGTPLPLRVPLATRAAARAIPAIHLGFLITIGSPTTNSE
jgi:hypothetical protein